MKTKGVNSRVGKGRQGLEKKWKKMGREVVFLCQKVSRDEHRRKEGLEALKSLGSEGETLEERTLAEEEKRERCKDIGSRVSIMVTVRNMSTDWMQSGWLHWKQLLTKPMVQDLLAQEAHDLMNLATEEESTLLKKRKVLHNVGDEKLESLLHSLPLHKMVLLKMMERLSGGGGIISETLFEMKENVMDNWSKGITQEGLREKEMKELSKGETRSHEEPLAVFIPLSTPLKLNTFQQYKMQLGRPKKGKVHKIEVGDIFIVHWRLSHSVWFEKSEENPVWIVLGAATTEKYLMY